MPTARFVNGTEYFEVADGSQFDFTNKFSFVGWLYPVSFAGAGAAYINQIFGDENTSGANPLTAAIRLGSDGTSGTQGKLSVVTKNGVTFQAATGTVMTLLRWQHFAIVNDGTTVFMWYDGKPVTVTGTATQVPTLQANNWRVGITLDGARPFDGGMWRLAAYTRALTYQEILVHMNGGVPQGPSVFFDFSISQTPVDISPYHAQVTVGNTPSWMNEPPLLGPSPPPISAFQVQLAAPSVDIAPEFLNIGTGLFAPAISPLITVPFLNIGTGLTAPTLFDGDPPPFVPPPLPPTQPSGTAVGPAPILPPLSSGGLAGIRFYDGPPWRWLVTDLDGASITFLDHLALNATVTYALNKPWQAQLSVPADNPEVNILHTDGDPFVSEGNRLLYGFRREGADGASDTIWKCRFAGKILQVEDAGEAEDARTTITAWDGWQTLYQRPMVNIDDEFPDLAKFFSFDDTQVGVIALTFLRNTIINQDIFGLGIDVGDTTFATVDNMPGTSYWGGPYTAVWSGRTKSVYQTTTQVDCDTQQGLMVAEVWQQMLDYGSLDLMLTPIYDPLRRPGYTSELSIYNKVGAPQYDAAFAWDKPGRNLRGFNSLRDGTKRANTIRYYADLTGPTGAGAPPVGGGIPISYGPSILKYGETWHEEFFPEKIQAAALAFAELQLDLLANGIHTIQVTPAPERMPFLFTEWFLGDVVPVYTSSKGRQENNGFMRIYGIQVTIDENSYEQVPQVLTSPDEA